MPTQIAKPAAEAPAPGVRMVAGRPYVFDADAHNAHRQDQALGVALSADVALLSDDEIDGLIYDCLGHSARNRSMSAEIKLLADRLHADRAARRIAASRRAVA